MSLHPVSRKMLIQLMEALSQGNIRSLGLLPANYIPEGAEALKRQTWAGAPAPDQSSPTCAALATE